MSFNLIIPAAGISQRLNLDMPKQFQLIHNKTILQYTLEAFNGFDISCCIIPTLEEYIDDVKKSSEQLTYPVQIVLGGQTRAESVQNALIHCSEDYPTLIHDAARPFVSSEVIQSVLNSLEHHRCVIPAISIPDTLKWVDNNIVERTISRQYCKAVQTPQGFHTTLLREALKSASETNVTDESQLMEQYGDHVYVVDGDYSNIKITYPKDLEYATLLIQKVN